MEAVQGTSTESFEALKAKLWDFMINEIYPNETVFVQQGRDIGAASNEWTLAPIMIELKRKAKSLGKLVLYGVLSSAVSFSADDTV